MQKFGVVVIGRNEGERLMQCLASLAGHPVVYVDSGSSDGSVERSRAFGAKVVELNTAEPFTAARARNAGMQALLQEWPDMAFVQFVDGDCEVADAWLETAARELESEPTVVAVCGRRRERYPQHSIYNVLCDIEWDTPSGAVKACGGDAMYRVEAMRKLGSFNEGFIAGEEPELCYRLRRAGWRIKRIDAEMTKHDADIHYFRQWWKRGQRSGYAYALGAWAHGHEPERYRVKSCLSVVLWAGLIPLAAILLLPFYPTGVLVGLVACYGYLFVKIFRTSLMQHQGFSRKTIAIYALFVVLQKLPELLGIIECSVQRFSGRGRAIIEYK